ncbi:MFS transporter [Baekduia soli]|uniref:MFS transporter n=1 Tax=Baekduia soli TaxID=496014 RepID=UPI001652A495|nr:MFS transporter [Baekduia soli]
MSAPPAASQTPSGPVPARSNVTTMGWAAFWSGMAQEMIYPLLPIFLIVALSSSKTALGTVEGLLGVGVTIARLVSGRAMDRGRSPLLLTRISYGLSLAARPLIALAPTVGVVALLRVADGLGKGGKDAPKAVLVAADADGARMGRAFGIQTLLDTLGSVAGPLVAGLILLVAGHGESGLRICFALAAIPAIGAVRQLARAHDTLVPARHEHGPRASLGRPFRVLLVAVLLFGLANSSDTLLLLRARSAGLSAADLAFLFAAFNLVYALMAVPIGALSDRVGRRPLLFVAWTVYVGVYIGFAFASQAWTLVALFLAYGIFYAANDGVVKAWITSLVPPDRRGQAFALNAAASGLLLLPASVIAGGLWDRSGPRAAFLFGAATAALALAVVALAPALRGRRAGL